MKGLYYPFIRFRDENWLRLNLLYWDEIHRIAPANHCEEDSALVQYLSNRGGITDPHTGNPTGFIKDEDPVTHGHADMAAQLFSKVFDENKQYLRRTYSLRNRDTWPDAPEIWRTPGEHIQDSKLVSILVTKLGYVFGENLLKHDLAKLGRSFNGTDTLLLHPNLAYALLSTTATVMSQGLGLIGVADNLLAQQAGSYMPMDHVIAKLGGAPQSMSSRHIEAALFNVSVNLYAPNAYDRMSPDELLDVKKEMSIQLNQYRKWIREIVKDVYSELEKITEQDILNNQLEALYMVQMDDKLKELEAEFRNSKSVTAVGLLSTVFTWAAPMKFIDEILKWGPNLFAAMIASGTLSLAKVVADKDKSERALNGEPGAFLVRLKQHSESY